MASNRLPSAEVLHRRVTAAALIALAALSAGVAPPALADDDDPPWEPPPIVPGPPGPALGFQAQVFTESKVLDGCASASLDVIDGRRVAWCLAPVYNTDTVWDTRNTAGAWARADSRAPLPAGVGIPFEPAGPGRPWWWGPNDLMAQGAAARAQASPLTLRAGAFAVDSSDRTWYWDPDHPTDPFVGFGPGGGSLHKGLDEITRAGARAEARRTDQITASGDGFVSLTFRLDGRFESGNYGSNPGGGTFSFAAALYDRSKLVWIDTGDDIVPIWTDDGAFGLTGVAYGVSPTGGPGFDHLLKEPGFRGYNVPRLSGAYPDDSLYDQTFTLTLDVTDGQVVTLALALNVLATGFDRCDDEPGDGSGGCLVPSSDVRDYSTLVDFSHSLQLTGVVLGGGVTGLQSALGGDYMALAVPEPAVWWLWLAGCPAVLCWARRRAAHRNDLAHPTRPLIQGATA
jgi:hypothetical protein